VPEETETNPGTWAVDGSFQFLILFFFLREKSHVSCKLQDEIQKNTLWTDLKLRHFSAISLQQTIQ